MANNQLSDRLRTALIKLMDVERSIRTTADELRTKVSPHPAARALFAEIDGMAGDHINAVCDRLVSADGLDRDAPENNAQPRLDEIWLSDLHPVSSSLRAMYTLLNEAIIGYSMIQPIASRFRDSWVIASEGTTGHLARHHTQEYAAAAGRVTEIIHDVVIWELDNEGLECRCTCPSCSIGICVGAPGSRLILAQALAAGRSREADVGVYVHPPRGGSPAEKAGLQAGDLIVAIDGTRVDSFARLQTVIRNHELGDQIRFKLHRGVDEIVLEVGHRSDIHDDRTSGQDECIQPAGGEFAQVQAREIHQQLREGNSVPDSGTLGLADLTARELQILRLMAEGASNPMIAAELVISRATVARHVANILTKLQLANRTEAATLATQAGLLARV